MRGRARRPGRSRLFVVMGMVGVAVALTGFAKTFFQPLLAGTFSAKPIVYIHGLFLFGWVTFFLCQSLLVQRRKLRLHRRMGWVGGAVVAGVVVTTLCVGTLASRRIAATGAIEQANGELLVVMIEMAVFAGLVAAALLLRRRPEVHKRLMLLALIGSLGPAWFRFRHYFPEVSNPLFLYSLLLADSLIVIAVLTDLIRARRVHPVYLFAGSGMIGVHLIEVFAFETGPFRSVAAAFAGPFI